MLNIFFKIVLYPCQYQIPHPDICSTIKNKKKMKNSKILKANLLSGKIEMKYYHFSNFCLFLKKSKSKKKLVILIKTMGQAKRNGNRTFNSLANFQNWYNFS